MTKLDLRDAALFGFSMGGGEVARYLGTHGSERVRKAGFLGAIPPFILKTADNPTGVDGAIFEGSRRASPRTGRRFWRRSSGTSTTWTSWAESASATTWSG